MVRDGAPILIEVKAWVSRADLALCKRKAVFYQERTGQSPQALYAVGGHFEPGTERLAEALGIVRLSDRELGRAEATP
ncbi:MAG: hypothetical protein KatS3mg102_1011 [Planctomycetota bacterium]|nr:MAG: hypothetical protein KatS3mg102_1011 [Planctomycetota bacterium]